MGPLRKTSPRNMSKCQGPEAGGSPITMCFRNGKKTHVAGKERTWKAEDGGT
jgi:hypothetical protein